MTLDTLGAAYSRGELFGIAQWKLGVGLILAAVVVLALLPGRRGAKILTSLRLTIWILGISTALVFLGSLAQVHEGLWNAQARWFKEWFIVRETGDAWWVPPLFPGGHLLGTILLINLLAAHWKRFSWSFQKIGIQLTHLGIIMLLVGQFLTDELAVESMLSFREGETKQYTEHHRDSELYIIADTDGGRERVVAAPGSVLAEKGTVQHAELPFSVRIADYSVNGDVLEKKSLIETFTRLSGAMGIMDTKYGSGEITALATEAGESDGRAGVWREALRAVGEKDVADIPAAAARVAANAPLAEKLRAELKQRFRSQMLTANKRQGAESQYAAEAIEAGRTIAAESLPSVGDKGAAERFFAVPRPEQKANDTRNLPYAVVELEQGGTKLGKWLLSPTLREQTAEVGGKSYRIGMRFERYYLPYTMKLIKATHDVYQGTDTPKDYRSRVLIDNTVTGERRETEIYMNQPLRYEGLTFFQSQMGTDQRNVAIKTSGLQVVQNPSWLTPYAGCLVVGLGMMWQFLWHLSRFFSKRMNLPAPEVGNSHPALPVAAIVFVLPDLWILVKGIQDGSGMVVVSAACTLFLRALLGFQLWRGRYLGFALVFLCITTMLVVPFAIKYHELGAMLWPLVIAPVASIALILIALAGRKDNTATT